MLVILFQQTVSISIRLYPDFRKIFWKRFLVKEKVIVATAFVKKMNCMKFWVVLRRFSIKFEIYSR